MRDRDNRVSGKKFEALIKYKYSWIFFVDGYNNGGVGQNAGEEGRGNNKANKRSRMITL